MNLAGTDMPQILTHISQPEMYVHLRTNVVKFQDSFDDPWSSDGEQLHGYLVQHIARPMRDNSFLMLLIPAIIPGMMSVGVHFVAYSIV